jgi:hypothetical protein
MIAKRTIATSVSPDVVEFSSVSVPRTEKPSKTAGAPKIAAATPQRVAEV